MRIGPAPTLLRTLAVLAGSLVLAGPALADAPDPVVVTAPDGAVQAMGGVVPSDPADPVGGGDVITDGADQTEPAASDDAAPAAPSPPKRGEVHVLDTAVSSSPQPRAASAQPAAAPAIAPRRVTATATRRTLPFTGVNAGMIALLGAGLLAAGLAVGRAAKPGLR